MKQLNRKLTKLVDLLDKIDSDALSQRDRRLLKEAQASAHDLRRETANT